MLLDGQRPITPTAARRLKAIEEFTELGAGFKIALRDLEIRGAGNILGTQQSGHIAAVGYELYCQLLENAVRQLKKMPLRQPLEVNVDLPWAAYLPRDYVAGQRARIEVYRRLTRVRSLQLAKPPARDSLLDRLDGDRDGLVGAGFPQREAVRQHPVRADRGRLLPFHGRLSLGAPLLPPTG